MLFEVIHAIRDWLSRIEIPCQILSDSKDFLHVFFETDHALAELIAGMPSCAPYRFVSFTVLDIRLDLKAEPVFCFHDDENCTISDILHGLDRGAACITIL